jgi:hypothetical protein
VLPASKGCWHTGHNHYCWSLLILSFDYIPPRQEERVLIKLFQHSVNSESLTPFYGSYVFWNTWGFKRQKTL